ncbi:BchE/P-methylase family protein [Olavius sp. associated proteobacterium Delta 1]|nr:BchE/P-methylase family protein [Olavius sp. associated proteobacterium Delta 1]
MKITFIMPSIGKKADVKKYIKTWQMEPLSIAVLAALTPDHIERKFFDDRLEKIDYQTETDLVAITVETYTARRAYEISKKFRDRGIQVIMGGFHPSLNPDEAQQYADSILIGEAEGLWQEVIQDASDSSLKKIYQAEKRPILDNLFPDRSIYAAKKYLDIGLVETGRGCRFQCDFCTICEFFQQSYTPRPIPDIIKEIRGLNSRFYFFVDDNIVADISRTKELLAALIPLKIRWFSQGSINMAKDPELLSLLKASGCEGVLIGFESLNKQTLANMNKAVNIKADLDDSIKRIHDAGIRIYATFIFGYPNDTFETFEETYRYALKHKFFITAFNHVVPFPGSMLYRKLKAYGSLLNEKYWLDHSYCFGDVAYTPHSFTPSELSQLCYRYRKKFFSLPSILTRLFSKANFSSFKAPFLYLLVNLLSRADVGKRQGLPIGMGEKI